MTQTILRVFDNLSAAERARSALLEAGFPADTIELSTSDDEAGPVRGNFASGNIDTKTGPIETAFNALIGADNHTYAGNYDHPQWHAMHLLRMDVADVDAGARAARIADRFGGVDPSGRAP